jgi:mono/diheme cytochrome c family protein
MLFHASGCATCHTSAAQTDETKLGGGTALSSDFGTFYMPNISSDPEDGIGSWTTAEFVRAMREGVLDDGRNAYPAYPYTSYQRMTADDLGDLFAYIKTLPAVKGEVRDNDLKFPFSIRRGIGLWKLAFLDGKPLTEDSSKSASWNRGQYLVEGPGHCAECHSPRDALGVIPADKRFAGGPDPEGNGGWIPNITSDHTGLSSWDQGDIAAYLLDGKTPHGGIAGGSMAAVVRNTARLSQEDRDAIAAYIHDLAPIHAAPGPSLGNVPVASSTSGGSGQELAALAVSSSAAVAQSDVLYTTVTAALFIEHPSGDPSAASIGNGKIFPASQVKVLARDGQWLQVSITGWQQVGSERAIYAFQGKRIVTAVLGGDTVDKVKHTKTVNDPDTGLQWTEAELTAWTPSAGMLPGLDGIWSSSAALYGRTCGTCHAAKATTDYLANQWPGSVKAMRRFTALSDEQDRLLEKYLQFHAKDVTQPALPVTQ